MGRQAHVLLAAGNNDGGGAGHDLLSTERHGTQTRSANLVYAPSRRFDREARGDGGLAGRVLASTRRQHLSENDFRNIAGLEAGALEGGSDGDLAEFMRGHGGERSVERADGGSRST